MNKKTIGIIGLVVLIAVVLIISISINPEKKIYSDDPEIIIANATEEVSEIKSNEKKEFIEINVDEYIEMYNGEEKRIVLVGRPTCQYCQIAAPILQNIAYKYNIDIYYLNTDNFKDGDDQKFIESDEAWKDGFSTPTLMVVNNGKIHDLVNSLKDTMHYIEFMKNNGYIK